MNAVDCVFRHLDECDHTGEPCQTVCKHHMKEIPSLSYRDHFDLFEKRRTSRSDARLKVLAIVVSVLALLVSLFLAAVQLGKVSAGQQNNTPVPTHVR